MKELIEKAIKLNEEMVARIRELKELEGEPAKPAFKVGDWVLITKPKDVRQKPCWSFSMDKYDGQTLEIEEINSDGYLVIDGWKFNSVWCEKVEEPKSKAREMVKGLKEYFEKTSRGQVLKDWEVVRGFDKAPTEPKVGDLCILWDNDKSEAIIGILSSIDISDYPYGVSFISYYKNCIKFESVEQYNEFING